MVITEEDEFYIPLAIDYLLNTFKGEVLEVVCARNPLLPGKIKTARMFYKAFGFGPIFTHALRLVKAKLLDTLSWMNFSGRYYSVKRTCEAHGVPYSYSDNINGPVFLQYCRDLNIDIIASVSPTQIFKEDLISLPKHGCLNIHTAKLPKYRGLYPAFWAMASGEKQLGISIHYIEKGIDTGRIIVQDQVDIPSKTTLDHMLIMTKKRGAELLAESVKNIYSDKVEPFYAEGEGSYFSFPTSESYKKFKQNGYKLW
jgi:methionyl-tRNA formyltransferase